ncbi:MAG: GNVR domain-containing protein [Rectinemataceae bacterium]|nr:GNVR domain-containing protein [Rectinemataceae bacterium]
MEPNAISLNDIIAIIKRRKWSLIAPFASIVLITAGVALFLPPIYKATSTILIEEQEIPLEYVQTMVTSYVEQRLQEINQKIMSTSRLEELITAFDLYAEKKDKWSKEEIIEKMRKDIKLEPISTEVVDRRTGRPTTATIAFTLSYEGKNDATKVYQVAGKLASLFLEENLKARERQSSEASKFFDDEIKKIKADMNAVELEIADFKGKHVHELPELIQVNMQDLYRVDSSAERLHEQLRSLKAQEASLVAQVATASPQLSAQTRLKDLQHKLAQLKTIYSNQYPDVLQLQAEIGKLEESLATAHEAGKAAIEKSDNPAYITLNTQLTGVRSEIESSQRQISGFEKQRAELNRHIAATPGVEQSFKELLNERDSMKLKYTDLMNKFMEARVAQGLEKEQKGERFTMIDPAQVPEKPDKPNRIVIMLIGIVLGMGAGVGFTALREFTDDAVRDSRALAMETSLPVLAAIPLIKTEQDFTRENGRRKLLLRAALSTLVVGLTIFHFFVMDFAIVWAKMARHFSL